MKVRIDDTIVEALYGQALDSGEWRPTLEAVARTLQCDEVSLVIANGDQPDTFFNTGRMLSRESCEQYEREFHAIDPKISVLSPRRPGYVFNDAAHFDNSFVKSNQFYQEYSRPIGVRHTLDTRLQPARGFIYFAGMRTASRGHFQPATERAFEAIARHVARVSALRARISAAQLRAEQALAALDSLAFGVVVFDASGAVRVANAFVRRMMEEGDLQWRQARLIARHRPADRAFQELVGEACAGEVTSGSRTARIPRSRGGCWTVTITALPAHTPLSVVQQGALAIFCDPNEGAKVRAQDLIKLYDLTPAEAELALALGGGQTLDEAAQNRGVRRSTVRSQLEAILSKTGLHRQLDLARLIAGLPGARLAQAIECEVCTGRH